MNNNLAELHSDCRLRQAFKSCMRIVFPPAKFPTGVSAEHHRDLARTFAMGWCENMKLLFPYCTNGEVQKLAAEYTHTIGPVISQSDWYPDSSWKWW